ncbi:MAG: LysM peptidoglycan-binding domain-containing protein [Gammaproteobacteria bacterium]|nr:LysM peptidoglycan-binding domain-containing protein [Gammaproteobacteria bacterium]MCH9744775.1 LysM peptidoglycan-binding domain-containing protein [Gammaproteobacteria bacterium]
MNLRDLKKALIIALLALLLTACPSQDSNYSQQPSWHLTDFIPFMHSSNLWHAMSGDFALESDAPTEAVKYETAWFAERQDYINELTHNAQPYIYYVYQQTQKRGMPAEVALMPMIESNYNPFVYSPRGATGLWQMMPGTASGFGLNINWWYDGRRDIIASTNAALNYLQYLHKQFGDWLLAIAAYDSGEGTVRAAIRHNERSHRPTDFWDLSLPRETKDYVPKLLALAHIIKDPSEYLLKLKFVPNEPFFSPVKMNGQINLTQVAYLANTKVSNIRLLNPGFRRWATSPSDNYSLLLPNSKIEAFNENLSSIPKKTKRVNWFHHDVKSGDSLYALAEQYHTKANIIKRVNNLKGNTLRIGENLLIPLSAERVGSRIPHINADGLASIAEDRLPGPQRVTHLVARHDNLWTIAERYHVTPAQIQYWNKLGYHSNLHVNQQLVLWLPHHNYYARSSEIIRYTVRPGESLSGIAQRYRISTKKLMAWNNISNPSLIRAGEVLHIYRS